MNRVLITLVAVEALIIVWLILDRDAEWPVPMPRNPGGAAGAAGPPAVLPPVAAEKTRPPAVDPGPGGVFLFGRIADAEGAAPGGRTWIYIRPVGEKQISILCDEDGWYGRGGLTTGRCEVKVQAPGCEEVTAEVEIPVGAATHQHDFLLVRAEKVPVFFLNPVGDPLVVADWVRRGLSVIVTRERPRRLPPTFLSGYSDFGSSQYRPADWDDDDPEDGRHGTLTIRGGLPVFVSAVVRSEIIETIEVEKPVERLDFRLGPERITELLSAVTFRLTADADTLDMKRISVSLSDRQSTASGKFDVEGQQVTLRDQPPGGLRLEIRDLRGALEPYDRNIVLPAGKSLDLGTIQLKGAVPVRGRVLDAEGNPVNGARITFDDIDRPWEDQIGSAWWLRSGPDGSFAFTAGPRRLCVRATPKESPPAVAEVDLRGGAVKPIVIRLSPGPRVRIEDGGARPPYLVRIEDPSGRVHVGRRQNSRWPLIAHLAPGSYDRVVIDREGVERRTPFTVGTEPLTVR